MRLVTLFLLDALVLAAFASSPCRSAAETGDPEVVPRGETALPVAPVAIDIRPGLCPNHLRLESSLTLPVAVLGTMDFDVANIDPGSVRLGREGTGECAPSAWGYADVGMTVIGSAPDCNNPRGDGLDDLVLEFPIADLVKTLELADEAGQTLRLHLRGKIVTGQAIEGADEVVLLGGSSGEVDRRPQVGFVGDVLYGSQAGEVKFAYYTDTSDRVVLAVYDCLGRVVKKLADADMAQGIYRVTWAGVAEDGQAVPDGVYFAIVRSNSASSTRKFTLKR